ncbi:cytochrome c553 [Mesorhizobium sp. J18]|uniref:c-type cytochrome n=1 Tax=Mesorhizobium sp. J18 TaxID=935263 RepID=UPI001199B803|nr:cytochrome c [Mesorhizobium sp. J18]TWH01088.1 cytochrome c553 [Mesorhizobium sp. J18]
MFRYLIGAGFAASLLAVLNPAVAADAVAGKTKAAQCAVCHGLDGLAKNPDAPNLAGDSANYIRKQLDAYRSGARSDPQMTIMAKNLTDEDIADLAAWYSSIEVTVEMPK